MPYKSQVEKTLERALVVAMRGRQAIKNDRPLSLPFGDITDPEAAYETAVVMALAAANVIARDRDGYTPEITRVEAGLFEIEGQIGSTISRAFDELHLLASASQGNTFKVGRRKFPCEPIVFQVNFNGVIMRVNATSNKEAFLRDYGRASGKRIPQPVGPEYSLELSEEEQAVETAYQERMERAQRERVENRANSLRTHRERNAEGREFDLVDVLAITTGFAFKDTLHMRAPMEFMVGEDLETLGLAVMESRCRDALIEQHPWLKEAVPKRENMPGEWTEQQINDRWLRTLQRFCGEMVDKHGEKILVKPLPADEPPV